MVSSSFDEKDISMIRPKHQQLLSKLSVRELTTDEIIFTKNQDPDKVIVVKSGYLKLKRQSTDGRAITLDILKPGEQAGLIGKYANFRDLSITALVPTIVYSVDMNDVRSIRNIHPEWLIRGLAQIQNRLVDLRERFHTKARHNLRTLVICQLCKLGKKFGSAWNEGSQLGNWLQLQDLVEMTGYSPASVYRCVANLKAEGLLETQHQIFLPNPTDLKEQTQIDCSLCSATQSSGSDTPTKSKVKPNTCQSGCS